MTAKKNLRPVYTYISLFFRDPDIVRPPVPTEVIFLQAVTVSGANLPTVLVGSENIPTIGIGGYFALQLNFVTSSSSSK